MWPSARHRVSKKRALCTVKKIPQGAYIDSQWQMVLQAEYISCFSFISSALTWLEHGGMLWINCLWCKSSQKSIPFVHQTLACRSRVTISIAVVEFPHYRTLPDIFRLCLHLCDRATLGSCSSLRRIALTMFLLWSASMLAGVGLSPRPRALWSFTQSHGPFLCVSSQSDLQRPAVAAAEVQGEKNTPNAAKDAASALHTPTRCRSPIRCWGGRKSVQM